jgi:hypothetical protein
LIGPRVFHQIEAKQGVVTLNQKVAPAEVG